MADGKETHPIALEFCRLHKAQAAKGERVNGRRKIDSRGRRLKALCVPTSLQRPPPKRKEPPAAAGRSGAGGHWVLEASIKSLCADV